jgi:peptidyl-prolyl cis-trans isomerase A (cyclophilin A)
LSRIRWLDKLGVLDIFQMKSPFTTTVAAAALLALMGQQHAQANTTVTFNTSMGSFQALLYDDVAPVTVANFLAYVEAQRYQGSIVHRAVPGFVIQGGGYYQMSTAPEAAVPTFAPIPLEHPYGNVRGALSMARTTDPNSASSQWFINLVDNPFLDADVATGRPGYAVFGEILGSGMSVVDAIGNLPTISSPETSFYPTPMLNGAYITMSISAVPEPGRAWLFGLGFLGLLGAPAWQRRTR